MTSSRPYLIRAIYEWLVDNKLTPYMMVDAMNRDVNVPEQYIEDGKIILNVAPIAVRELLMTNSVVSFEARFSGITHYISFPTQAVKAVYSFENGRGMVFDDEDDGGNPDSGPGSDKLPSSTPPKPKGRPSLKVVK
jgi:stringent starvation protein B